MEKNKKIQGISGNRGEDSCEKSRKGATKRCCYRLCNSSTRLQLYEQGQYYFISFPKPCYQFRKGNISDDSLKEHLKVCEECAKSYWWLGLCGRLDDEKFNHIKKINKDTYICSLHFFGESGPSEIFPDPLQFKPGERIEKVCNFIFGINRLCYL